MFHGPPSEEKKTPSPAVHCYTPFMKTTFIFAELWHLQNQPGTGIYGCLMKWDEKHLHRRSFVIVVSHGQTKFIPKHGSEWHPMVSHCFHIDPLPNFMRYVSLFDSFSINAFCSDSICCRDWYCLLYLSSCDNFSFMLDLSSKIHGNNPRLKTRWTACKIIKRRRNTAKHGNKGLSQIKLN